MPADDKALTRHFEDSLLVLGELAWRCWEEDQFSFCEKELVEFASTHESLAACKLGLVFKEASLYGRLTHSTIISSFTRHFKSIWLHFI